MSTLLAISETPSDVRLTAAPVGVRRSACYLPSYGQAVFAWLHGREQGPRATHGVLICPPLGYEQVHAHRAVRHLADDLAAAGFLACRFDYDGTGDSPGRDEDTHRVTAWLTNIRDAVRWLREVQGCTQVSVIGLRLGALLAVQACVETPVANLVLWAPVVKGRQYVRESEALAMAAGAPVADDNDIEAAGFVVTRQTGDEIAKLDSFLAHPKCRRLLIVARDDLSEDRRLLDHVLKLGIDAQQVRQPGYADMMAEPHQTQVPTKAIAAIIDWLSAAPCDDTPVDVRVAANELRVATLVGPGVRERIVTIAGSPDLTGILTEPAAGELGMPLVVLLNAGAAYRVGPNRFHVLLARQIAEEGFRCLRMDLTGLGDSVAVGATHENDSYGAELFGAVDRVFKYAETKLEASRVVLVGLCSGAYVAFQAAAQFSNPALVESVLINPLTFFWKEGMAIESPDSKELVRFHYYSRSALQPAKWWKLVSGNTRIGVMGVLKMLVNRLRRRKRPPAAEPNKWEHDAQVVHPASDDLAGDLKRAMAAGRRLTCFFSREDPGSTILMYHARRLVKALCRAGKMSVSFVENADHTFSRRSAREAAITAIVRDLCERYRS